MSVKLFGVTKLSPEITEQIHSGINQFYDLNFEKAEGIFTQISSTISNHPIGYVYLALTSIGSSLIKGPTEENTLRFHAYTDLAVKCALRSKSSEKAPWNLYYSGVAFILKSYSESKQQNYIDSLRWLKRGVSLINRSCKNNKTSADAKMLLGAYQYFTSRMPWYFRFFASLLVEPANQNVGIENLEYAVSRSKFGKIESEMLLSIAYSWNNQYYTALDFADKLLIEHPENYCFGLLKQEIFLRQRKYNNALNCATNQLLRIEYDKRREINGLAANQYYILGLIYTKTKNYDEALRNFAFAFSFAENKPCLKAWAILRQGTVYDLKKQHSRARDCYEVVKTIHHESDLLDAYGQKFASIPYRGESLE
ncbi:MAG: hypothetical protein DRI44_01145 [Chlamydiae bacterium]|nr:MAG: hypothetical protein DRI44_01145 [Chlamydiota bacterium]